MARLPQWIRESGDSPANHPPQTTTSGAMRIKSEDLLQDQREIEIEHQGRIYRLRVTQMNKLILTA